MPKFSDRRNTCWIELRPQGDLQWLDHAVAFARKGTSGSWKSINLVRDEGTMYADLSDDGSLYKQILFEVSKIDGSSVKSHIFSADNLFYRYLHCILHSGSPAGWKIDLVYSRVTKG